ncbi:MAG: Stk1 family PASTA domain-containing Ser/Thr kinase [Lachnospiraceae bacterium]
MLENGTIIANRYEIIGKIGTGGTADVYKAKCHKLNRYVAIKVLKREYSEDRNFIRKFRIEAQSAAGMAHANIVNVYDVGDENGIYYIVMELVEGITLKQYIDKKGALDYKEAVSIAIQIAQGIEVAHRHNIIHRDIKPQNIIISKEGKVKVTDFGIAKVTNTDTVNSIAMGSVHYISPEQARGGYSDVTSDIYSFGITLYEMCAGRVPFDGDSTVAVALMHIQNDLVPPSVYNPAIPISVEKIILKCAQKRMDRRYQSATELIADLKRALVTPYENFVDVGDHVDSSPTVMFTQDDMNQINERTKSSRPELDVMTMYAHHDDDDLGPDMEIVSGDSIDLPNIRRKSDEDEYDDAYEEHHRIGHDDDDEDDEHGSGQRVTHDSNKIDKIMLWLGVAVAAVIVIVTLAVVMKLMVTVKAPNSNRENESTTATPTVSANEGVEVPPLIGLTEEEAKKALNERGLGFMKNPSVESDVMPVGYVLEQSVESGVHVAANTQVFVTISAGSKSFELIDVRGMTEETAIKALEEYRLKTDVEYEYSLEVEQGKVIRTSPNVGSTVHAEDTIYLVISRGREIKEGEVPNLLNKDEETAKRELQQAGFVPQLGGTTASATVEQGKVVSQSYQEGTVLPQGSIVEYVLSSGNNGKYYQGTITMVPAWYNKPIPEGIPDVSVTREVRAVLRQSDDTQEYSREILEYTDINSLEDYRQITFDGIKASISTGNVDFYVRYTWTDPDTGEVKSQEENVMSVSVPMTEVTSE